MYTPTYLYDLLYLRATTLSLITVLYHFYSNRQQLLHLRNNYIDYDTML